MPAASRIGARTQAGGLAASAFLRAAISETIKNPAFFLPTHWLLEELIIPENNADLFSVIRKNKSKAVARRAAFL